MSARSVMRGASNMHRRVTFSRREVMDDGYGNTVAGPWTAIATMWSEFRFLRGSETVLANTLSGSNIVVMRIRASTTGKQVGTDCKAEHEGVAYNVRAITPSDNRAWLDVLCESGVAV